MPKFCLFALHSCLLHPSENAKFELSRQRSDRNCCCAVESPAIMIPIFWGVGRLLTTEATREDGVMSSGLGNEDCILRQIFCDTPFVLQVSNV
jgi:hypothetical protein